MIPNLLTILIIIIILIFYIYRRNTNTKENFQVVQIGGKRKIPNGNLIYDTRRFQQIVIRW